MAIVDNQDVCGKMDVDDDDCNSVKRQWTTTSLSAHLTQ